MNIVLITQDEPFYLKQALEYFVHRLPAGVHVKGCVLLPTSPFGKRSGFVARALDTFKTFGLSFFVHYASRYVRSKVLPGQSVSHLMRHNGVPLIYLANNINHEISLEILRGFEPDLLVSVQGNQIFRKPLLEVAPCINLHTALLPRYRGLMPTFWVLANQESHTGVSVFFVDEGIDSGPIIVQRSIEIAGRSQEELIRETKILGMEALLEAIARIKGGNVELMDNDDSMASYYSFPTREDVAKFKASGARFF